MPQLAATILVADDETHVTHILSLKLGALGHRVLVARDGHEALTLAQQHRPDLIITDFQMPLLSGYDMARRLFSDQATRGLRIIMLTARGHKLNPDELKQTHIIELMDKPFQISALSRLVTKLLATQPAGVLAATEGNSP